MTKENIASLWLGGLKSESDLRDYVKQDCNDDGDVSSDFMKDFLIDYYDHDFEESYYKDDVLKREDLLEPLSYSASFIRQVDEIEWSKYNSVITLYDFEYDGNIESSSSMVYAGSYSYRK